MPQHQNPNLAKLGIDPAKLALDPETVALASFVLEVEARHRRRRTGRRHLRELTLDGLLVRALRRGIRELAREAMLEHEGADSAAAAPCED
jgi:hypothetical protein